jgi:Ca-activated chloride channel family protein
MSNDSLNDDLNLPDRLSAALQTALREPTPGDPLPSNELRVALAARLSTLSSQPHSSSEVQPMTTSSNSGWFRVAATLVASGCAAALAIAILLPEKSAEQNLAQIDTRFKDATDITGVVVSGGTHSREITDAEARLSSKVQGIQNSAQQNEFTVTGSKTSTSQGSNQNPGNHGSGQLPAGPNIPFTKNGFTEGTVPPFPGIGFNPAQQPASQSGSNFGGRGAGKRDPLSGGGQNNGGLASGYQGAAMGRGANADKPATLNNTLDGTGTGTSSQLGTQVKKSPYGRDGASPSSPAGGGVAISGPMPADPYGASVAKPTYMPHPAPSGTPQPGQQPHYNFAKPTSELAPSGATPLPAIKNPEPQNNLAFRYEIERKFIDSNKQPGGKEVAEKETLNRLSDRTWHDHPADHGGEQYEQRVENIFQGVRAEPLSTFSIDVDTASYTNCRRFLDGRQLPPTAAVRVEEFINYFRYDYPQPTGKDPFSVNMEVADCPWTPGHKLLRVGLKGKEIDRRERPQSNLVFLVDVSGSMSSEDKLPLLRDALHRWVNELSANDRVTICTYAGDAGLRLPTTRGDQKDKLHAAIETLQSGGSTHGSAGIKLAYEQATANFLEEGGVNRVLWATDGDLNVGTTGDDELVELITNKAKTGVFLTVLGVGTGNLKDAKLEKMADKGNGVYAYLDSPKEARKVLIEQMSGTTITIAKDVKIQIEFNPAEIAGYRLIGYENRILAAEDFANDKKDAGEIGAGHTVTALYEIVPVGEVAQPAGPAKEPLKYQAAVTSGGAAISEVKLNDAAKTGELLTLKLRFKQPDGNTSELREIPLKERGGKFTAASKDFQFAGCVAQLAMILRDSQYRGTMTTAAIAEIAAATKGEDKDGSRQEFVDLVKRVQELGK